MPVFQARREFHLQFMTSLGRQTVDGVGKLDVAFGEADAASRAHYHPMGPLR